MCTCSGKTIPAAIEASRMTASIGGLTERWYDLTVILDDATSEIYYAQLVERIDSNGDGRVTRSDLD